MEDSQTEVEMDLAKENQRSDWSVSSSEWMSRKLFWPLFWESGLAGTGPEDYGYAPADAVLGGVGADGWSKDGETKDGFGETFQMLLPSIHLRDSSLKHTNKSMKVKAGGARQRPFAP